MLPGGRGHFLDVQQKSDRELLSGQFAGSRRAGQELDPPGVVHARVDTRREVDTEGKVSRVLKLGELRHKLVRFLLGEGSRAPCKFKMEVISKGHDIEGLKAKDKRGAVFLSEGK
jgi:hypothetical protein